MIEAYTGLPGSGKTYCATDRLFAEKMAGKQVFANFHSRFGHWKFCLWDDLQDAWNAFVMIDEAHVWFNSRSSKENDLEDLSYWQQHRKDGTDLALVTQDLNRVDKIMRELVAFEVRHVKFGRVIVQRRYNASDSSAQRKPLSTRPLLFKADLSRYYFSNESIGTRDGAGYRLGRSNMLMFEPERVRIVHEDGHVFVGPCRSRGATRAIFEGAGRAKFEFYSRAGVTAKLGRKWLRHPDEVIGFWIEHDKNSELAKLLRRLHIKQLFPKLDRARCLPSKSPSWAMGELYESPSVVFDLSRGVVTGGLRLAGQTAS